MDPDRITGKAKETLGKAQAGIGEAFGDSETEARGRARQASGAAENMYGQAKDAVGQAADAAKDAYGQAKDAVNDKLNDPSLGNVGRSAEDALRSFEAEVKARPLLALLIAGLIGFVLAQLTTR